jgi:signal peptide peptidase SppA
MSTSPPDRLHHLRRFLSESPWAMLPTALAVLVEIVERRALGVRLADDEIEARIEGARRAPSPVATPGTIAVLPIFGPIVPRANVVQDISGPKATSAELVEAAFRAALADTNVSSILLDVDSPGGNVQGIPELAATLRSARGQKPVVAVVNHTAASAAYWLASQADEIVVTPSGEVGSIGVFTVHDDLSAAAEKAGVRRTYIAAGAHKVEGNPFEPLSDATRQYLQQRVDAVHDEFVRDVARGRRVSQQTVRETFGQGRMVKASDALKLGMADRIGTFQETVDRLAARNARAAGARAEGANFEFTAADYLEFFGRELQPFDEVADESAAPAEQAAEPAPETASDERDRFRLRLALGGGA